MALELMQDKCAIVCMAYNSHSACACTPHDALLNAQCIAWCADTRRWGGVWAGGALTRIWAAEEGPAAWPEVRAVGAQPSAART